MRRGPCLGPRCRQNNRNWASCAPEPRLVAIFHPNMRISLPHSHIFWPMGLRLRVPSPRPQSTPVASMPFLCVQVTPKQPNLGFSCSRTWPWSRIFIQTGTYLCPIGTYFQARHELLDTAIEATENSCRAGTIPLSLDDVETTELGLLVLQNLALEPHIHLNGHIFTYFRAQFELVSPVIEAAEHSSCVEA